MDNIRTDLIRKTEKLLDKKCRYSSHLYFLEKCAEKNYIPKGFKIKWTLSFEASNNCKNRVTEILDQTSTELVTESIKVCKATVEKTSHLVDKYFELIKFNEPESEKVLKTLHDREQNYQSNLNRNKQRKLKALIKHKHFEAKTEKSENICTTVNSKTCNTVKMIGDGNCFFRAVSYGLYENQNHHAEIRREVVKEIKCNTQFYSEYIDGDFQNI